MNKLYNTSLVVGSFNPPHNGHISLLSFAAEVSEAVIVQVGQSSADILTPDEKIILLRKNLFPKMNFIFFVQKDEEYLTVAKDTFNVVVDEVYWNNYMENLLEELNKIADSHKVYPSIVVSSERYGAILASKLGAYHLLYDMDRKTHAVSSTIVRSIIDSGGHLESPSHYFHHFLPEIREKYSKKICIVGTEGGGKSTLASSIHTGMYPSSSLVPEYGRTLTQLKPSLSYQDFKSILAVQHFQILEGARSSRRGLVISDTDALTTMLFAKYYLTPSQDMSIAGNAEPYIQDQTKMFDLYLVTNPKVYNDNDGTRTLSVSQREDFHERLMTELTARGVPFKLLPSGSKTQVFSAAKIAIKEKIICGNNFIKKRG